MAAFMDLHVKHSDKNSLKEKIRHAERLGYDVVAISYFVEDLQVTSKKRKDGIRIPSAEEVKLSDDDLEAIKWTRKRPRQLTRFTACLNDASQTHKLSDEAVQRFDLLAIQPSSEKTFHLACKTLDIDIIMIDVTEKLPFYMKRPAVSTAIERGIHFEIQYSPGIMDSGVRRTMIGNIQSLISVCKGKNVILSSGCEKASSLRGPYDVANLALLFGMTQAQGKAAVCRNCRAVLFHAETRRVFKSTINAVQLSKTQHVKLEQDVMDYSKQTPSKVRKSERKSSESKKRSSGETFVKANEESVVDVACTEQNAANVKRNNENVDEEPPEKKSKLLLT